MTIDQEKIDDIDIGATISSELKVVDGLLTWLSRYTSSTCDGAVKSAEANVFKGTVVVDNEKIGYSDFFGVVTQPCPWLIA